MYGKKVREREKNQFVFTLLSNGNIMGNRILYWSLYGTKMPHKRLILAGKKCSKYCSYKKHIESCCQYSLDAVEILRRMQFTSLSFFRSRVFSLLGETMHSHSEDFAIRVSSALVHGKLLSTPNKTILLKCSGRRHRFL